MHITPIHDSHPCSRCSYDLRGLDANGRCPECGTPITQTLPRCPRCPRTFGLWIPLQRVQREDHHVWECERCGGIGFDRGGLGSAVAAATPGVVDDSVHDAELQAPAHCGRCVLSMTQITIDPNTIIDRCDRCGFVWIDFGELPSVVRRARTELAGTPPPPQLAEWLDQPEKLRAWRQGGLANADSNRSVLEIIIGVILASISSS